MKSIAGKICTALLLSVYLVALCGFRLHECAMDHTAEVLTLLAGDSCAQVHHHHCEDESHCGHHHHHCSEDHNAPEHSTAPQISEAACCSNTLHILTDVQLGSEVDDDTISFQVSQLASCPIPVAVKVPDPASFAIASTPVSRALRGRTMLALYSVIRA